MDDKVNTRVISPVTALNPSTLEGSTLASCLMRLLRLHQQHRPCSSATLAAQLHLIISPSQTSLRITVNATRSQREQEKRNKIQQCFVIKIRRSNSAPSHSIKGTKTPPQTQRGDAISPFHCSEPVLSQNPEKPTSNKRDKI